MIWNGTSVVSLGIEDSEQGCQSGNRTCTESLVRANNTINTSEPDFVSASSEDFRPSAGGRIAAISSSAISDHDSIDSTLNPISEGERANQMTREFSGSLASTRPPGAFVSINSSIEIPAPDGSSTTPDPSNQPPTLNISKATRQVSGKKALISIMASASDDQGISLVNASILSGTKVLSSFALSLKNGSYSGKKKVANSSKMSVQVTATDDTSMSTSKTKKLK
jgi:hypothetical protein